MIIRARAAGTMLAALSSCALAGTAVFAEPAAKQFYDLPAQPLADSLRAVGQVSGRQIIISSTSVSGKRAPALRGRYSPDEAIRTLLAGSALATRFTGEAVLIGGFSDARLSLASTADPIGSDTTNQIIVTGTHLRGGVTASPIVTNTRASIENAGFSDLGSFVRSLPENFSGGQNPTVVNGGSQGNLANQNITNSSAFNLRGLGPDATLTLINGHRVAYDAVSQGVDISAIPVAAIERIDVVPDGASALYGSDAVGGVANIVLRRDYDGLLTSARLGSSTEGGNQQQEYNAVGGRKWTSGGFMAAVDLGKTTPIDARQRGYTESLDDSATLVPGQRQVSFVLAGHEEVSDAVSFQIDAQVNHRTSASAIPSLTTAGVFDYGLYARPNLTAFSVTPNLIVRLPADWDITIGGTYGESNSALASSTYFAGKLQQFTHLKYDGDYKNAQIDLEGPLLDLPGGQVRAAAGGGYRSNGLDVDIRATALGITKTTDSFARSQGVAFGYAEFAIPFVGGTNALPLIDRLTVTGAMRYESYAGGANVLTPKLGLIYQPLPDMTIKGSWGKSFKAPTLYQQYEARQASLLPGSIFPGLGTASSVLYINGGGINLKPERATNWTSTLEVRPRLIAGLTVRASYFSIRYRERVVTPLTSVLGAFSDPTNGNIVTTAPSATAIAAAIASATQGLQNLTGRPYDSSNIAGIIDNSLENAARQHIHGLDLALDYARTLDSGDNIDLSGSSSYLVSRQQLTSGKPVVELAGYIYNPPHWHARAGGTYQRGNVTVSAFGNYIGSVVDARVLPAYKVGSFASVDAVARVQSAAGGVFGGVVATIAIFNLLDEKPASVKNATPTVPPYDSTNYSSLGRVISLTITKKW